MYCARCNAKIAGKVVTQDDENYCSLECANAASGLVSEEVEGYFEEHELEGLYEEEE